jgi:hypothetical protein
VESWSALGEIRTDFDGAGQGTEPCLNCNEDVTRHYENDAELGEFVATSVSTGGGCARLIIEKCGSSPLSSLPTH